MVGHHKRTAHKIPKPPGFWDDWENVARELADFVKTHGRLGIMPSRAEFKSANRLDLGYAIGKHGGTNAAAERIGLRVEYQAKPNGYWSEKDNCDKELLAFIASNGQSGVMPTQRQLSEAGHKSLAAAISRHGGSADFAQRLNLALPYSSKPKKYWKDISNLEAELRQFLEDAGDPSVMPSHQEFRRAGRDDIGQAINLHGGIKEVADRFGLKHVYGAKPAGYWDDFEVVKRELQLIVGDSGVMPTKGALTKTGRNDLAVAIVRKHGGFKAVADKLGIERGYKAKEPGYWQIEDNIIRELQDFIQAHGKSGQMPTYNEMRLQGLGQLADEITKLGGPSRVAKKLGLTYTNPQKHQGFWDNFDNLASEIQAFLETQENRDAMPLDATLRAAGKNGILNALRKFGGSNAVADRLGIRRANSFRDAGYWENFENVQKEILEVARCSEDPLKMPSGRELREAGLSTLAAVISRKYGGFESVAKCLQLRFDGAGIGWTLEALRNFVSSLIPHLNAFTAAELYILFQQNGLWESEGKGRAFIRALATGRFPREELEKFVDGDTSLVDKLLEDSSLTLEEQSQDLDENLEDNEHIIIDDDLEKPEQLPSISTKDVLRALDARIISTADAEAAEYLVASGLAKIWTQAYSDEQTTLSEAKAQLPNPDGYAIRVKERFLDQYQKAKQLEVPAGYAFKVNGESVQPNLMQRHIASRLQEEKRMGNWSGTGAGKTLSAVLASRVVRSEFTVVCCPNSVVNGWRNAIIAAYPDSIVCTKTFDPTWTDVTSSASRYLVLNYEVFQQADSESKLKRFLERERIDFVIVDEIHYAKHRKVDDDQSKRRKLVNAMISAAAFRNQSLHVLGMSATPVINNLQEGKSLVELITGLQHDELSVRPTVPNCMALHQRLLTLGIRWKPEYNLRYEQTVVDVDVTEFLPEIKALGDRGSPLALEQILTRARLPAIRKYIKPKTLIYTHNVEEIVLTLRDGVAADGWKVGYYTGDDKSGLNAFLHGDVDVLIGSSAIGTGVDGLQQVCDRLIVNVLPWTAAEFEQLKGRIYRQGQQSGTVSLILPLTFAEVNGQPWSWCQSKMRRLNFKKSIADAAVDGSVPEGHLRSPAQAYNDVIAWLRRLETGELRTISRQPIVMPLARLGEEETQRRMGRYGEFSTMNRTWNQSNSTTTHKRLREDPTEWEHYHALYRAARENWTVVPYQEMINRFKKRSGLVIADFGCGEAELAKALSDLHTVHSFDHVAINQGVIACDMTSVPLDDQVLDAAIFSLSLMGRNFADYLREAHRTLKMDGQLHIIEATDRFSKREQFIRSLKDLGFDNLTIEDMSDRFTYIRGFKSELEIRSISISF